MKEAQKNKLIEIYENSDMGIAYIIDEAYNYGRQERKKIMRLLSEAERRLTNHSIKMVKNTKYCLCCNSMEYDELQGILHHPYCVIRRIRELTESEKNENIITITDDWNIVRNTKGVGNLQYSQSAVNTLKEKLIEDLETYIVSKDKVKQLLDKRFGGKNDNT